MLDLLRSADHEIACVIIGGSFGPPWNINLFVRSAARNPMVFYASGFSRSVRRQERTQIVQIQIITDVAIEIAIGWVTRISFLGAPDLFARFAIPSKSRGTSGREAGRVDGVAWARIAEHQAVCVE